MPESDYAVSFDVVGDHKLNSFVQLELLKKQDDIAQITVTVDGASVDETLTDANDMKVLLIFTVNFPESVTTITQTISVVRREAEEQSSAMDINNEE